MTIEKMPFAIRVSDTITAAKLRHIFVALQGQRECGEHDFILKRQGIKIYNIPLCA